MIRIKCVLSLKQHPRYLQSAGSLCWWLLLNNKERIKKFTLSNVLSINTSDSRYLGVVRDRNGDIRVLGILVFLWRCCLVICVADQDRPGVKLIEIKTILIFLKY